MFKENNTPADPKNIISPEDHEIIKAQFGDDITAINRVEYLMSSQGIGYEEAEKMFLAEKSLPKMTEKTYVEEPDGTITFPKQ